MPGVAFQVPQIQDNPDGWGPSTVPEHLKDVPFAPFGKGDKLGRASDWTQAAYQKYPGRGYQQGPPQAVFNFFHNEEEESFHLVDNRPVKPKPFGQRGRFQQNRFQQQKQREREAAGKGQEEKKKGGQQQKGRQPWQQYGRDNQRLIQYSSSVEIRPEWAVIEQIPFASLAKLSCAVGEATDVAKCGELEYYDKAYDRITVKAETPLEKTKRAFRNVTTSEDPVIKRLATAGAARVFATDAIITALMCVKSSVYSWDVLVTRRGDKLFLDLRPKSPLNLLTVNETAPDQIPEDKDTINGVHQLALEATAVNQNFSQQVLVKGGEKYKFDEPNPFISGEDEALASCAYRYRKWRLNEEEGLDIIVRCELDGVINNKGEDQLVAIKALNEWDLRAQDWRKKLESQRGAALAFETKNNKNKMAKWTAGALLAGADMMKLGYVSRASLRDNLNHVVLGTQVTKPRDFAGQINLNMDHCWGIVRALVDMMLKLDDGKYLLLKDPNKDLLRLYAVPEDAFEANYNEHQQEEEDGAAAEFSEVPVVPIVPVVVPRPSAADDAADD